MVGLLQKVMFLLETVHDMENIGPLFWLWAISSVCLQPWEESLSEVFI